MVLLARRLLITSRIYGGTLMKQDPAVLAFDPTTSFPDPEIMNDP
jgi:hypothetical protein